MTALIQLARNASPYLAVELLLPGGSVVALLLWLFRHRFKKGAGPLGMPEIWRWFFGLPICRVAHEPPPAAPISNR